jgi:hypothetical protein
MRRVFLGALAAALLAATVRCGGNPIEPSGPDLGGRWRGTADIGVGLATVLDMTLLDGDGTITGNGGGADCRYYAYCSSFGAYTVTGTHDAQRVRLSGTSIYGPTWTMEGRITGDAMSGLVAGTAIPEGSWAMTRAR